MVSAALVMNFNNKKAVSATVDQEGAIALSDRRHIQIIDSNEDGVPDWQANLIDSEPIYLDATTSEPYVPPDTVTGQFSARFFRDLITLESFGLLADTKEELIEAAIKDLEEKTAEQIYTETDLKNISVVTDKEALRTYGNLVAGTVLYYQTTDEHELAVFERMTSSNNPRHLEKLAVIEKQYDDIVNGLLELEVPSKYIIEHLAIVNSFSALRHNVYAMQLYFDDPFYTSMRYRRLAADVVGMNIAIHNLHDALYLDENIQFEDDDTMPILVTLLPQ